MPEAKKPLLKKIILLTLFSGTAVGVWYATRVLDFSERLGISVGKLDFDLRKAVTGVVKFLPELLISNPTTLEPTITSMDVRIFYIMPTGERRFIATAPPLKNPITLKQGLTSYRVDLSTTLGDIATVLFNGSKRSFDIDVDSVVNGVRIKSSNRIDV